MEEYLIVGKSTKKLDALAKVTGSAKYSGDLSLPGMLYAKTLFAERPHARIIDIDITEAKKIIGVVEILTAKDVPVNEYGLQKPDQPVLCGPGSTKSGTDIARFIGDQIAVAIAEDAQIAEKAVKAIKVTFKDLPVISNPLSGLEPDAYPVHPEISESNICLHDRIRKGDIDKGFSDADVVIESDYSLPHQEHVFMEPEAGLAYIDDEGRITVTCAGQWTHTDQEQIAHALNLPIDKIRVVYAAIGGAFGGREDMSVQITLALATLKTGKPVKMVWSRRESMIGHGKRHPATVHAKWGATREGKLVAAEMKFIANAGAYLYTSNKVLGNTTIVCTGPYSIPNVKVDTIGVYTNNVPSAAFRGFGAPQGIFVAEMQINKIAAALGIDPVEIRMRNALRPGNTLDVGTEPIDRITAKEVIEAAAKEAGWQIKPGTSWQKPEIKNSLEKQKKRGIGFAAGFKNIGFSFGYQENSWARIELIGESKIEKAILYQAGADVGQGAHTAMMQIAAEALGIPLRRMEIRASDTANSGNSGSASASRLTFMAGNAIIGAAKIALENWQKEDRPAIGEYTYLAPKTTPFDEETGHSLPNFCYAYAAQAVEVEVDPLTGKVQILKVTSGNDVGKAINPKMILGQIEGAIVQAQGYALIEDFRVKDGLVLTDSLSNYLIPTIMDIPDKINPVILELADPNGPYGAVGVGELPFLPLAPAIIAAIYDATGVWINRIPATPEFVYSEINKAKIN
ncbi:MAG TPA: molybdopterin cofactor-binding domain-containing protein [Pelolinea sp.]|nr:molybdopterin cofactor-binding domain-containing protein [Pelolinea sp.]